MHNPLEKLPGAFDFPMDLVFDICLVVFLATMMSAFVYCVYFTLTHHC